MIRTDLKKMSLSTVIVTLDTNMCCFIRDAFQLCFDIENVLRTSCLKLDCNGLPALKGRSKGVSLIVQLNSICPPLNRDWENCGEMASNEAVIDTYNSSFRFVQVFLTIAEKLISLQKSFRSIRCLYFPRSQQPVQSSYVLLKVEMQTKQF